MNGKQLRMVVQGELEDLYSGAKHFSLFSQRLFYIRVYLIVLWWPFLVTIQTHYTFKLKLIAVLYIFNIKPLTQ